MKGLMLHCGANEVDFNSVIAAPTPTPTPTHVPIAHHELVDLALSQLQENGYKTMNEAHSLSHEGARYFGLFRVSLGERDSTEYGMTLGIRNAHDKTFPAGLVVGSSVFVCDNLSFMGETKIVTRHTKNIWSRLPQVVARAVGGLADKWSLQDQRFEAYKEHELSPSEAHDLIIRAAKVGGCTARHILPIAEEYANPSHPEFKTCNLWALFNAFTEKLKGNLNALPNRTQALHAVFDAHIGLLTESDKATAIEI